MSSLLQDKEINKEKAKTEKRERRNKEEGKRNEKKKRSRFGQEGDSWYQSCVNWSGYCIENIIEDKFCVLIFVSYYREA